MRQPTIDRRTFVSAIAHTALLSGLARPLRAAGEEAAEFLIVGDWGRRGTHHQREVAAQMAKTAKRRNSRWVISVGDNFYDDGVQSTSDSHWQESFEQVYSAAALQVPWYVALGNHDYRGVPQAQIDYAANSSRWRMPARYYQVSGRQIGAPQLDLFVIDTSPLVHAYREKVHSVIAANIADQDTAEQLRWLDESLSKSEAPWKMVVGHHTLHSGGSAHGDTQELVEQVKPLLLQHGVQAYINGHDHDLQHLYRDGIHFLCCGAGSEARPVQAVSGTVFCAQKSGFVAVSCDADTLRVEYRDMGGQRLHHARIARDGSLQKAA
jgi:acid phosphatase